MFYRLNDKLVMRGWQHTNAVLIERPRNQYKLLTHDQFTLLLLCDGVTDLNDIPLSNMQKEYLNNCIERGLVNIVDSPSPLLPDQVYRFYANRFVNSCFWSITGRCNFKCRHCYMNAPESALGEISHSEAISLIDQMADCGVLKVDLTGGEPFVRKDFWELIDRIIYHKMTIGQIYTNGWLLNEATLRNFQSRGLKPEFSISFDGVGWHDWMRGIEGAEKAALRALKLCKQYGFPVNVEVCVHKGNLTSLPNTLQRLAQIGVPAIKLGNVAQTQLWEENSLGYDMTFREFADAMLDFIPQFFQQHMPVMLMIGGIIQLYKDTTDYKVLAEKKVDNETCLTFHLCGSARSSCYITPEGRLLPCLPMTSCKEQEQFARFQDIGLRKGLSDSFYMQFVDKRLKDLLAVNEKCAACAHKYQCAGGCRASALQQSGDLMGSDLDQCFLWENGYVEKIHRVADEAIAKYCKKEDTPHELCHETDNH